MKGLLAAAAVEVVLVTYRSVTGGGIKVPAAAPLSAPLPSLYTSVVIVYGGLAMLPDSLAPVPGLIGWGFVVATFLNLFNPGAANNAAASNVKLGSSLTASPSSLVGK